MILMSRCIGIVGVFDSQFTKLLLQIACNRNERGHCPASKDLFQCQPNAKTYWEVKRAQGKQNSNGAGISK
jgi:hypothetical protein